MDMPETFPQGGIQESFSVDARTTSTVAPLNMEDQRLYSKSLPDVRTPHPISKAEHEHTDTYIIGSTRLNWLQSQTYCRKHYTDLASIRDQQEKDRIFSVINSGIAYWIGLSRDSWKWSDQSNFEFTAWRSTEPRNQQGNEFCGYASAQGWGDTDCALELSFICSVRRETLLKVVLKPEGSVDLNDPLVSEAVLKAMERQMSEHGINHNVRLSWRRQPNGEIFNREANSTL
ncbi:macrophage mannose receptor 1-like [Sphaeramia orbicularis]|uniref:macrophage mannose receptor 1-like n=1 Tax=Sphaeramia orbicularis TaxID=375764 RepID=UPI00117E95B5|nr:macrophage mannose receptor 1-like [Sphaeramia orbicularis]